MIIYRIEHILTNVGPYYINGLYLNDPRQSDMAYAHCDSEHPDLTVEIDISKLIGKMYEYYCGFNSIEQLTNWFDTSWLEVMQNNDFVVKLFDIDDQYVIEATYQTFFKRNDATYIQSVNPLDVLSLVE